MSVDQATEALVRAKAGRPPIESLEPTVARELYGVPRADAGAGPTMASERRHRLRSGDGGEFELVVLEPAERNDGALVWLHAGGWTVGSAEASLPVCRYLAAQTGLATVAVDYRLAPEHPFPAALHDVWASLRWLVSDPASPSQVGAPLVVAGESAGGNLAAVSALRARDEGEPALAAQLLVSPVLDSDLERQSYHDPENQNLLTAKSLAWFWDRYQPDVARRLDWRCSPVRADRLSDLAPAIIVSARHEVPRDEIRAYAERLRKQAVPVVHREFEGQAHGFFAAVDVLPTSAEAISFAAAELRRIVGLPEQDRGGRE
ncbi:MAG: alpha/beta hydrolase [Solirubrobacterales bacterium]